MIDFGKKKCYTFGDLIAIVKLLRAPDGCPWDREQTHRSIRNNFIEETYEAVEAIDTGDADLLKEELGDVLLQVALHAAMEEEQNVFNIEDVTTGICEKLIYRHPHIFSDVKADDTKTVLHNWDILKKKEKGQKTAADALYGVASSLPALMRAEKVQSRAVKAGFGAATAAQYAEELSDKLPKFQNDLSVDERKKLSGEVLFASVGLARLAGVEAEEALTGATDRYIELIDTEEKAKGSGHN